ncbi:MAG: GNAT family N-acetyltransferase [Pseudomonadota bacterium]
MTVHTVAIVDPYDAGTMLAPAFAEHGVAAVMVGSTLDIPDSEAVSFDPASFARLLPWSEDPETIVAMLRDLGVDQVIAGSERGVELADRLAGALGLSGNGTGLSVARRDKLHMIETAAAYGIRTPRQIAADSLDAILAWIDTDGGWPAILKPRRAKGSEGVRLCTTRDEAAQAFAAIHGVIDRLGSANATVLAQQFLIGREYVIDTVSLDGRHRLAALWAYGKPPPAFASVGLLATKQLLPAKGPLAETLFGFAVDVLEALGIQHGAGHCEVIVDAEGPALVEIGARLHGGPPAHLMCRAATGTSQLDLLIQSYVAPETFRATAPTRYTLNGGAAMALLRDDDLRGMIETLPSAQRVVWNATVGAPQPPVAGLATLIHPDAMEVAADLEIVTGGISCGLVTERAAIEAIAPEWRALLEHSSANRAFGGPCWYRAALDTASDLSPALVTASRDGRLVGVLPLAWDAARKTACFTTLLSDYNDAIVALGDLAAARALMRFARRHFPAIELGCVRPDADCIRAERMTALVEKKFPCPFADLSAGYEAWLASRSPRFRHDLAQFERRAARSGLAVARLAPGTPDVAALFLGFHRDRFGERSLFARDGAAAAFVRQVLPDLLDDGSALIFALRVKDRIVGLNLCMRGADSLGYWNAGFESAFAPFSPGTLMIHAALREACALGLAELDFLRGAELYKTRWCTGLREIGRLA